MSIDISGAEVISDDETDEKVFIAEDWNEIKNNDVIEKVTNPAIIEQQQQPAESFGTEWDDDSQSFHKITVRSNLENLDMKNILQKIETELGRSVRVYVFSEVSPTVFNFYVQGKLLANSIVNVTSLLPDVILKVSPNSQNPPAARITPELHKKLTEFVTTRFNPSTGHLDLSNFAETNGLTFNHWLPLNKPTVRSDINDIITLSRTFRHKITAVDLSRNNLTTFDQLEFVTTNNKLRVLIANDNLFESVKVLEPLRYLPLTELTIHNNPLENVPEVVTDDDGQAKPYNLVDEIKKFFPKLKVLNNTPVGGRGTKRPMNSNSDTNDRTSSRSPSSSKTRRTENENDKKSPSSTVTCDDESRLVVRNHHNAKKIETNLPLTSGEFSTSTIQNDVSSLERKIADSAVEIKNLSTLVHEMRRRQRKTEDQLDRLSSENANLNKEIDRMKRQHHREQEKLYEKLDEQQNQLQRLHHWQKEQQQQQKEAEQQQQQQQLQKMRYQPQHHPSSDYHNYRPPISQQPPFPPTPSSAPPPSLPASSGRTLDDLSHMFERPRR